MMEKKYMIIDGNRVEFTDEKNMLAVIQKAGINLPRFCYYSELSVYGACRMCVVEDERVGIIATCSTPPRHKAEIKTNPPRLHQHRKMILELLLASHCRDCTVCDRNGHCRLQILARRYGINEIRFRNIHEERVLDTSSKSIVRDSSKCILCGDCVRMCNEIQNVGAIDFAHRGSKMLISTAFGRDIADTECVNCGQCAAVCPTGAITIKDDTRGVWDANYAPKKRVVAQIAPAVRVAIGEEFGFAAGENHFGKMVAAMRHLGFDKVFDTSVGADLTIMEETAELIEHLESDEKKYPLFTSCCPGWIRYVETRHPELMKHVSTCKSPMQMFGTVLKKYYEPMDRKEKMETVSVAIMPCTAKKYEAARDEFKIDGVPDVDYVLTTQELIAMIQEIGIAFEKVEAEACDMPFGLHSGAGEIFGATGGVTEAAVRRVVEDKSSKALKEIEFMGFRGMEGIKVSEIEANGIQLRIGVVSGLRNAETLIEKIESGEEHFDFVEVMACPGGCVAGGGQPFGLTKKKKLRAEGLYKSDKAVQLKRSDENPLINDLYDGL